MLHNIQLWFSSQTTVVIGRGCARARSGVHPPYLLTTVNPCRFGIRKRPPRWLVSTFSIFSSTFRIRESGVPSWIRQAGTAAVAACAESAPAPTVEPVACAALTASRQTRGPAAAAPAVPQPQPRIPALPNAAAAWQR